MTEAFGSIEKFLFKNELPINVTSVWRLTVKNG